VSQEPAVVEQKTPIDFEFDQIPPFDRKRRKHLWVVGSIFLVEPKKMNAGPIASFGAFTPLAMTGPACFYCEQEYTDELGSRHCAGDQP